MIQFILPQGPGGMGGRVNVESGTWECNVNLSYILGSTSELQGPLSSGVGSM